MVSIRTIGLSFFMIAAVLGNAQQPATIKIGSSDVKPMVTNLPISGGTVTDLHLKPFFITTIRLPEPATSVAVGDKTLFDAEHSTDEPRLVFVKPKTKEAAESNLAIALQSGQEISIRLISDGSAANTPIDWDHYMRTFEAGHLLDEAIPQIRFVECPPPSGRKMIDKCLGLISYRESPWSAFNRFIDWLAWGLAVSLEMPEFDETTQESLYRTFNLEPLLLEPHDYLGTMLAEHRTGGWNPHAFFPTPHNVTEFMVQMTLGGGDRTQKGPKDPRLQTVLDPCVGTGRMLLHASNFSYCLYGCDIDPLVAMITRINGALYAPWLAFPLSEGVLGRTLPPPPPAPLPVQEEARPSGGETLFRCDDRGQGLLFS